MQETKLQSFINLYGKDKINTYTKYPSILTLHSLGEKGRLLDTFTTPIAGEKMYATEKIDGTNVRIICYGSTFLVGAREFILHYSNDLYFDTSMGIVHSLKDMNLHLHGDYDRPTIIYGELYGGRVSSNSKWYGQDKIGFRVFDIVECDNFAILDKTLPEISRWREHETEAGLIYGHKYLTREEMLAKFPQFEYVPLVEFDLGDMTHQTILDNMRKYIPTTNVALTDKATNKTEGLVLRNEDRTKIVKIRFEDYERTLR